MEKKEKKRKEKEEKERFVMPLHYLNRQVVLTYKKK
jgi:hypothetical protein